VAWHNGEGPQNVLTFTMKKSKGWPAEKTSTMVVETFLRNVCHAVLRAMNQHKQLARQAKHRGHGDVDIQEEADGYPVYRYIVATAVNYKVGGPEQLDKMLMWAGSYMYDDLLVLTGVEQLPPRFLAYHLWTGALRPQVVHARETMAPVRASPLCPHCGPHGRK